MYGDLNNIIHVRKIWVLELVCLVFLVCVFGNSHHLRTSVLWRQVQHFVVSYLNLPKLFVWVMITILWLSIKSLDLGQLIVV